MKKPDMQAALKNAAAPAGRTAPAPAPAIPTRRSKPTSTTRPPSRVGKVAITAWLPPQFISSFRLIQAQGNRPLQDLAAEAFNELFRKYNVPTVSMDEHM
jgi:hypothetical protein